MPVDFEHARPPLDEMCCRDVIDLITEYLDDVMKGLDRARFDAHLASCPGCTTYLDQLRQTTTWLGQLSEASMPILAQDAFLRSFRDWKRESR